MGKTRILLVDDHTVLRAGLKLLLDGQPDMLVAGEAGDGQTALTLAATLHPDVILLDLTMPGLGGLDALPALRKLAPDARILILTMHDDEGYLRQALKMGAVGYVLKKAAESELLSAIRAVVGGEVYVQPTMARCLLDDLIPQSATLQSDQVDVWDLLTEREQEVLRLVALGHTSAEIADLLSLSPKTVDTYRARGMEKLGLRSRAALVQFAIAHGLLSDNPSA